MVKETPEQVGSIVVGDEVGVLDDGFAVVSSIVDGDSVGKMLGSQELQQGQLISGLVPAQSVTNTPRTPGGLALFRRAQTPSGISPLS
mmetsp:Transcript_11010/g.16760  ORF Transcript_11010/g.16760 Transcript_11010/m.16760 type:complete len:88 (+) Transcript_11010:134-397(+)|eukprot:CAMPEP_0196179010 /NCGR_PEP_ID=MMETSP0911-20130528/19230_1 /TAXON_ID=49265 /ORGANISM="Thalassiosira rotula, Strain GSO102" /LENGTH=87 /DNA_ID=CAMNT_0041447643 /DNA_START=689 /DNA_END=952 /DNA_ORIENTATION=+